MSDDPAIRDLVARAAAGDAGAFGALFDLYGPRVHRFIQLRVREPADAEDLLQSVFLKVLQSLPRYQDRGLPFAAWLFQIVRNAVIDHSRTSHPAAPLEAAAHHPATGDDPADLAALAGERERLKAALDELPPDQRDVLVYRYFAGLSTREIGALMGRREGSVRTLQFRALAALRRTYEPMEQLEPRTGEASV